MRRPLDRLPASAQRTGSVFPIDLRRRGWGVPGDRCRIGQRGMPVCVRELGFLNRTLNNASITLAAVWQASPRGFEQSRGFGQRSANSQFSRRHDVASRRPGVEHGACPRDDLTHPVAFPRSSKRGTRLTRWASRRVCQDRESSLPSSHVGSSSPFGLWLAAAAIELLGSWRGGSLFLVADAAPMTCSRRNGGPTTRRDSFGYG